MPRASFHFDLLGLAPGIWWRASAYKSAGAPKKMIVRWCFELVLVDDEREHAACFCSYGSHEGNFAEREAFVSHLRVISWAFIYEMQCPTGVDMV
ncbi:hypothetical protein OPV22_024127 [Ensete ventricosum]|uniref:Uncharacterized protein n=1 Tax=Ensete ventricosum TaxID=4639 RepID=A0AAV8QVZ1_ENSVE|nr:hypothetical protein OPV22_024127 [Ensete ventricosum]